MSTVYTHIMLHYDRSPSHLPQRNSESKVVVLWCMQVTYFIEGVPYLELDLQTT